VITRSLSLGGISLAGVCMSAAQRPSSRRATLDFFGNGRSLFIVHCSLFTVHCSLREGEAWGVAGLASDHTPSATTPPARPPSSATALQRDRPPARPPSSDDRSLFTVHCSLFTVHSSRCERERQGGLLAWPTTTLPHPPRARTDHDPTDHAPPARPHPQRLPFTDHCSLFACRKSGGSFATGGFSDGFERGNAQTPKMYMTKFGKYDPPTTSRPLTSIY
jgi:hypothetical protein